MSYLSTFFLVAFQAGMVPNAINVKNCLAVQNTDFVRDLWNVFVKMDMLGTFAKPQSVQKVMDHPCSKMLNYTNIEI